MAGARCSHGTGCCIVFRCRNAANVFITAGGQASADHLLQTRAHLTERPVGAP